MRIVRIVASLAILFWVLSIAIAEEIVDGNNSSPMPKVATPDAEGPSDGILGEAKILHISVRRLWDREQLGQLSATGLRDMLSELSDDLRFELTDLDPDGGWRTFLQLEQCTQIAKNEAAWLQPPTRQQLATCAEKFAKVMANPDYRVIWERWTFKMTMLLLEESAADPRNRVQRQLADAVAQLQKALDQLPTGPSWKDYLKLSDIANLSTASAAPTAEQLSTLQKVVERFQNVATKPEFATIAKLPEFQRAAHDVRDFNTLAVPAAATPDGPIVTQNK